MVSVQYECQLSYFLLSFSAILFKLYFRLFLIFDYLSTTRQMPFSLLFHSYMTSFFILHPIKGFSCGELLCNTTLILMIGYFVSHWTLPPCPYYLFFDSLSKVSPLSVSILRRMISRLIPWKWCGGFLSSLFVFLLLCSVITYTVNPDTWSLKNFRYFIYLLERVFTGLSSAFVFLFLSLVCLWFYNNRPSRICQHIFSIILLNF